MIPLGVLASGYVAPAGGASYYDEVMADSPALYWRLAELSGTIAYDSSGNGWDGTYYYAGLGQPSLVNDPNDYSVAIGRGQAVWTPMSSDIVDVTQPFTVECVYFVLNAPYGEATYFALSNSGNLLLRCGSSGGLGGLGLAQPIAQTFHFVNVWDGEYSKVYRNGAFVAQKAISSLGTPSADSRLSCNATWTGTAWAYSREYKKLDEPAIYPYALSPSRILAHAQAAGLDYPLS